MSATATALTALTREEVTGLARAALNLAGHGFAVDATRLEAERATAAAAARRAGLDETQLLVAALDGHVQVMNALGLPLMPAAVADLAGSAATGIARVCAALLAADHVMCDPRATTREAAEATHLRQVGFDALTVDVGTALAAAQRISELLHAVTSRA